MSDYEVLIDKSIGNDEKDHYAVTYLKLTKEGYTMKLTDQDVIYLTLRQLTGRDESVIRNAIKVVYTRLERDQVKAELRNIGIEIGQTVTETIENIAAKYNNLNEDQKRFVAELGAGVFHLAAFRELLLDIGKSDGVYNLKKKS